LHYHVQTQYERKIRIYTRRKKERRVEARIRTGLRQEDTERKGREEIKNEGYNRKTQTTKKGECHAMRSMMI
jgi:hypothetical protein